jgi:DNA polymerase III delta prime subunit
VSSELEEAISSLLQDSGFVVYSSWSDEMPSLVAAHHDRGLLAIDFVEHGGDALVALNRRVSRLREDLPELARVPTQRLVVADDLVTSDGQLLTRSDALTGMFVGSVSAKPLTQPVLEALEVFFAPRASVVVPRREPMTDEGATGREEARLELDAVQSEIAIREVKDVLLISGPPGSGKTLVLAARACWLAKQNPGWIIQILCFNRLLVPYLEQLVWGHANIDVRTFGRFTSKLGIRVSLDNEEWASKQVGNALAGLKPRVDALLIDEWQDFMEPWTRLALATVRPGRGGTVLAGDPKQALYRDGHSIAALGSRDVETASLTRPYRSTRQILDVTSALDEALEVPGKDGAFSGRPVDLVWAENVDEIAAAIARDIRLLIRDEERRVQDIGVLLTRRWNFGKVMYALKMAGVPATAVYPNKVDEFDLGESTVKVMTVHSAKGYEFGVVFLVGLEHLGDPDGTDQKDREVRTGYVGATRAKDQLVLTYSRENMYLDRIRALPSELVTQWVWPDDYPEVD